MRRVPRALQHSPAPAPANRPSPVLAPSIDCCSRVDVSGKETQETGILADMLAQFRGGVVPSLLKRDCVSDCVVPSCTSITCSANEICVLSSQTCSSCPTVSCVSTSLTATTVDTTSPFPKGAIAGIAVAAVLLLVCAGFLFHKLRQRRQVIKEIGEKASLRGSAQEMGYEDDDEVGPSSPVSRFPSNASIQIGLGPSVEAKLDPNSRTVSPLPSPNDHFFSADELLRMSYAESTNSAGTSRTRSTMNDGGAAIMQANNPILAVRAKAAVMQFTRRQSGAQQLAKNQRDSRWLRTHSLLRQSSPQGTRSQGADLPLEQQIVPQSVWEEESVASSPIENELITPDRFNRTPTSAGAGLSSTRQSQSSPTKLREDDSSTLSKDAVMDHEDATHASHGHAGVASRLFVDLTDVDLLDESASGRSEPFDWHDPAQLSA